MIFVLLVILGERYQVSNRFPPSRASHMEVIYLVLVVFYATDRAVAGLLVIDLSHYLVLLVVLSNQNPV